ncbi:MAG: hypothetical protein JO131_07625 [Gammaproteobacteria bacterium]|nr:hypothetical protein [Gammaproteobacteria bacterium]
MFYKLCKQEMAPRIMKLDDLPVEWIGLFAQLKKSERAKILKKQSCK